MTLQRSRHFQHLRRQAGVVLLAAGVVLAGFGVGAAPSQAAPPAEPPGAEAAPAPADRSGPGGPGPVGDEPAHVAADRLPVSERAPLPASKHELRRDYDEPERSVARPRPSMNRKAVAAPCNVSDFTSRSGWALVDQIKASTTDCVNTLFSLTGSDAYYAFREAQMASVAYGLRDNGASYPGNNSTGTAQLTLYLRAGYYVQWYNASTVGTYGATLRSAIQSGLDSFFGNSRAFDVNDANGETLAEAVTLIDSAEQNAHYLHIVKRLLNGYNSSYNSSWWMLNAVNNVYIVLFRGHQVPEFVSTVQSDPSVLDTLYSFAINHKDLLSGEQSYLTSNAGRELGRFLQHTAIHTKSRPLAKGLLTQSSLQGPTAPLWVGVAEMTDYYDKANCAYYDTCNLQQRLLVEVLPINHTCSSTLRIRAQQMTASELSSTCTSLQNQDAYFHGIVNDPGPVANDRNTSLEVVAYNSSTDYQTYAGAMWGIDTNNGGMYLEGDPSAAGNQARFIAYEAEWLRPAFEIWNLNHEYTHYLDGRFNMYGDFGDNITTPTIWWIEGFAEYVSYSYRNLTYSAAITEAGRRTYALSTLFDTTYSHDTTRIYRWGYLAVRYMLQSHRGDMTTVLGYYRTGNWTAARTYLRSTIGSRYDTDWYSWLSACAAGNCGGGGSNQAPTASFTASVSGLTASFTDRSSDPDGSIASRRWDFGDGTTSTVANPSKTYAAAGTYTVRLTVTDNQGATGSTTQSVTVGSTTNQPPTARFTHTANGLGVTFTDQSTDPDGSIASRAWEFGDGTTSTAANPAKSYAAAGTYTVRLTVTDNQGATGTTTQSVTVTGGGTTLPECTGSDVRMLGKNCQRSNRGTTAGNYDYLYIYLPSGTTQLSITSSGGTGNCDLYYNASSWATTSAYTHRSTGTGNTETVTVTNPSAGYNYISLHGATACSGVTVSTRY